MYYLYSIIFIIIAELLVYWGYPFKIDYKYDKSTSIAFLLVFLVVLAMRPDTVPDTLAYSQFFKSLDSYEITFVFGRNYLGFENGFNNLSKLIFQISQSFQFYLFSIGLISSFLHITGLLKIYSYLSDDTSDNLSLFPMLMVYIPYFGFMYPGIVLRGSIALGFCLYYYYFLLKKKYLLFGIFFTLSIWFHNSSIIFFLVILFTIVPWRIPNNYIFIISIILLGLYIINFFDMFIGLVVQLVQFVSLKINLLKFLYNYVQVPKNETFRWAILFFALIFILIFGICRSIDNKKVNHYINILFLLMIAMFFGSGLPVVLRGIDYFSILSLPLVYGIISSDLQERYLTSRFLVFSLSDQSVLLIITFVIIAGFFLLFLRTASFI